MESVGAPLGLGLARTSNWRERYESEFMWMADKESPEEKAKADNEINLQLF